MNVLSDLPLIKHLTQLLSLGNVQKDLKVCPVKYESNALKRLLVMKMHDIVQVIDDEFILEPLHVPWTTVKKCVQKH